MRASILFSTLALVAIAGCQTTRPGGGSQAAVERADRARVVDECRNLYLGQTTEVAHLFVDRNASADKICQCVADEGARDIRLLPGDPDLTQKLLQDYAARCIGRVAEPDFKPGTYPDFLLWQQHQ